MLKNLLSKFKKKKEQPEVIADPKRSMFLTHVNPFDAMRNSNQAALDKMASEGFGPFKAMPAMVGDAKTKQIGTMDNQLNTKSQNQGGSPIPDQQVFWYASQSFIGYQICAMMSQNWLVKKCCSMPAKDAVRKGYEISGNDGTKVTSEMIDAIRKYDVEYRINYNLMQLVDLGRVFGIRIAMFIVDSDDANYYYKPYNPDGVKPGSYKGISQIDPYWISPQLDSEAAGAPASIHFYEPTWWNIAGRLVHRTHLVIFRTEEVPDILKPTYIYAGVSIPQKIYDRVYAAERTANEAPLLALTKRTDVINIDLAEGEAKFPEMNKRIQTWVYNRDNYGIKTLGLEESMQQFDTSLADLDAVIMTQYQLVAAAANVPAVKLLGTAPKGFNSTGEFEEANYHEELESIQTHDLTPLLNRHHELLIRSRICGEFGVEPFEVSVTWTPLDALTEKEQAEINKIKAETGYTLSQSGAIDGFDERERIISDPNSGYSGMERMEVESDPNGTENDWEAEEMGNKPE